MKLYSRLAGVLAIFISFSVPAANYQTVPLGKQKAMADRVLARFKVGTTAATRADVLESQRVQVRRQYSLATDLVSLELLPAPRTSSVAPGPDKSVNPGKDLLRRIKALQDTDAFVYVEPDYMVAIDAIPSDAAFANGTLWGLNNTGASGGVAGDDIQAEEAWNITTGDPNVIVGVIDTGIRYTHQELSAQVWNNPDEIPGNGLDDDNDGYIDNLHGINSIIGSGDPMDDNDHGTHVSGTIGAQANGGGPHVGVAWNVRLMGLKFLDSNGSGNTSDAIECVNFAVEEKARLGSSIRMILSNSWGGGGFSQGLLDAIAAARNAGILFVAAAGNESNNNDTLPSYPANYEVDNVISVAAIDRSDNLASFSNRGANTVHLGAPGVDIYSSVSGGDALYATFSGTSMATPHVSGVAALIWSAFPNASLAEVRQRLLVGAVPIPSLNGMTITGGRLNALNSLTVAPDGNLEMSISVVGGLRVIPGTVVAVRVSVTDLSAVNNATVTASLSTGGNLTFTNDGNSPDQTAGDNVYSANMTVPDGVSSYSLTVNASALGKSPANSTVVFTVIIPPANDNFANREIITSLPALRTGSNRNSTSEPGEPDVENTGGGSSVWWSWTASQSGVAAASTEGSDFDTLLGVYTGNAVNSLTLVGSNDDVTGAFTYTSTVLFQAVAGQTYHFLVDGFFGDQGDIQFNLQLNATLANDDFANRAPIAGINKSFLGYNLGATHEAGELPNNGRSPDRSVWWEWDSGNISGTVFVSTAGSSFDTRLAIYSGSALGSLTLLGQNNDVSSYQYQSEATFQALAGQNYQIVVDSGWIDDGAVRLTIAQKPSNDDFYAARTLTGEFALDTGLNIGATGQSGEPDYNPGLQNAKSVWWKWTAPKSGKAVITTDGSVFDTTLAVYTGQLVNALTPIAANDDRSSRIYASLVSFGATQGITYYIRVNGFFDGNAWVDDGTINLLVTLDGASQLGPPELREDNTLSLELTGEPERPYVLSVTPDFATWTPVSTNTPISRRLLLSQPAPIPGAERFYRAQPASLVQ